MSAGTSHVPYCGTPPVPAELWRSWNLDPFLLAGLAAAAMLAVLATRPTGASMVVRRDRTALLAGVLVVALATVSPLCRLGVALFSIRMAQHLLLVTVAAPLLARGIGVGTAGRAPAAGLAFAACLWLWHTPAPYGATLESDALYWAGHLSLLASAIWLWGALLARGHDAWLPQSALAAVTFVQMGLLGALLTVAPGPLYAAHLHTTRPWGLSPLEDQQLAGLLCWIPGGLLFLAAGVAATAARLREPALPARV